VGLKDTVMAQLRTMNEDTLRAMKKSELEAMCDAIGLSPRGTRADLVLRLLRAKDQASKARK